MSGMVYVYMGDMIVLSLPSIEVVMKSTNIFVR